MKRCLFVCVCVWTRLKRTVQVLLIADRVLLKELRCVAEQHSEEPVRKGRQNVRGRKVWKELERRDVRNNLSYATREFKWCSSCVSVLTILLLVCACGLTAVVFVRCSTWNRTTKYTTHDQIEEKYKEVRKKSEVWRKWTDTNSFCMFVRLHYVSLRSETARAAPPTYFALCAQCACWCDSVCSCRLREEGGSNILCIYMQNVDVSPS